MKRRQLRVNNVILPIWLIVWIPSWLWLFIIPANYFVDLLVLRITLKNEEDGKKTAVRISPRVCIAGFFADFIGLVFLIALTYLSELLAPSLDIGTAIINNDLKNTPAVLLLIAAVALSGLCIYFFDFKILKKANLNIECARKAALCLALFTAPYLYLVSWRWFL